METAKSYVYFSLTGDDFDPDYITQIIGINPTEASKKGNKGKYKPALEYSCWKLSTNQKQENILIENLVEEIVNKLYDKIEIINELKTKFQLSSHLEIVIEIDTNPVQSTPALGHDLRTIEFLYRTKTTTDVDIYRIDSSTNELKKKTGHEAAISNPLLEPLKKLIGEWKTAGTHPYVPGTVFHGRASFEWAEGGAFLIMRSEIDEKEIPSGTAIFGSDDSTGKFYALYFDERKVSRKYEVAFDDNAVKWWRNAPDFSQRYTWTLTDDGNTLIGKGEMCKDGKTWEKDLELTYSRLK